MAAAVDILGVKISNLNIDQCADKILKMLDTNEFHSIFTPNSEIILSAYQNPEFMKILNTASLLTADGIGVIYASKILGTPIKSRAAGYDVACELLSRMAKSEKTLYLFGSAPGIAETAKKNLEEKYSGLKIVGIHDGYFDADEEQRIISDINEKSPDLLFVCLGAPKQEKWIFDHSDLNVRVAMGLGGCLDVFAGNVKRAPDIFIKLGLEWFYRLMKEPTRFFRMLALPKFLFTVIKIKLFGGKKNEG